MKIGLLGGSFDPLHKAHLALAQAAQKQLRLDRVYFVVARQSPFKRDKRTPAAIRLSLVKKALATSSKLKAANWELKRKGPSYTVDTIRAYKRNHPAHRLFFITGSDTLNDFHKWKNPAQIRKMATLVVGRRPGAELKKNADSIVLKGVFPSISSSGIRKQFYRSASARKQVPPAVAAMIKRKKLYRNESL